MPDIFPDIEGQAAVSIQISRPLASTDPGLTFTIRDAAPSIFSVDSQGLAEIGVSKPLDKLEELSSPYVQDIYLAYLTFECPPMPSFGGTGQIFPWTGVVGGDDGQSPVLRKTATHIQWSLNQIDWINLLPLEDIRGPAGAEAYVYNQNTPASNWTINHNLGYYPSVEVINTAGQEVDCGVQHVSTNQVILSFSPAMAGQARLS
jgi:hypothetical protein